MVSHVRHPNQGSSRQREREHLGKAKSHGLEDKHFAYEVTQGNNIGPHRNGIDGANVQVVGSVASNNRRNDSPGAKESTGKGSDLVGRLGVVLRRDQLVDTVLWVVIGRGGRELRVANEATVVDAPAEVQRHIRLKRVADGDEGELLMVSQSLSRVKGGWCSTELVQHTTSI